MTLEELALNRLRRHPSSWAVDEDGLRRIAARAQCREVLAGHVLYRAGQKVTDLLLVVQGRMKLVLADAEGTCHTIRYIGRGDQFGLLALSGEFETPVDLVADQDTQLVCFSVHDARRLVGDVPMWHRNLVQSLGAGLRDTLLPNCRRSRAGVVAFVHASGPTRTIVRSLVDRLRAIGESPVLLSDKGSPQYDSGSASLHLIDELGRSVELEDIVSRLGHSENGNRVFLDVAWDRLGSAMSRILEHCDRVYFMVPPQDKDAVRQRISTLGDGSPEVVKRLRWVWCLDAREHVAPWLPGLAEVVDKDLKVYLPDTAGVDPRSLEKGLARLVHDLRGFCLGIALAGGAARGMAHLGVLQSLDDAGIVFDAISGTSAGAMAGITYAAGIMSPDEAAACFARDLTPTKLEQTLPGGAGVYLLRKYRRGEWDRMLRKYLHDWRLEQLPVAAASVSVDLVTGRQVTARKGDAVQAILDSINLPGLSPPICRDGKALVDGGVLNALPADVLVSAGADFVIAVDVGSHLPREFAGNRPDTPTEKMKTPGVFETVVRAMNVQHDNMLAVGSQAADFVIEPDVSEFELSDFQHAVEIAAVGRAAADAVVVDIRKQLRQLDISLAPK